MEGAYKNYVKQLTSLSTFVFTFTIGFSLGILQSLSAEMEKLKLEGEKSYRNNQNDDNRGNFRRPNNSPHIIQKDQRNRDGDDQRIQAPLQNNLVTDEEGGEEEGNPKIHFLGDTSSSPHLTQSAYEESLMASHLNELRKE
jgi:hypothetical protein